MKNLITIGALCALAGVASADLMVTEIMSKSDVTGDWFELTNFGGSAVDITDWSYDDESADLVDAAALNGITSIAAGESVILISANDAADIISFRSFWGGLSGVQVGWHDGSGLGKGDGITLFDASDSIALQQFYGDGDTTDPMGLIDDEHAGVWAGGEAWDSANYIGNDTWVAGVSYDGQYGIFASAQMNSEGVFEYGSLGYAVPTPGSLALIALGGLTATRRRH